MRYMSLTMKELNPRLPETVQPARLQVLLRDNSPRIGSGEDMRRPVVLVLPGGGYSITSEREADPVALPFLNAGFQALTLDYSCAPDRYPAALLQAAATIAWVRENAAKLHADPENIYVCGFSAGGHLAASAGILWNEPVIAETLGIDNRLARPDGMILGYPVIMYNDKGHKGSFENLLGPGLPEEAYTKLSLERRVDDTTPPAFLWHTWEDGSVPLENTLELAAALRAHKIPFELHVYPYGGHGLSVANEQSSQTDQPEIRDPHIATWMNLCIEWIKIQSSRRK